MTNPQKNKLKIPSCAIFFVIALIGLAGIRFRQYSNVILPENGFFRYDGGFMNIDYYVFFAIALAIFLILCFVDSKISVGIVKKNAESGELGRISAITGFILFELCGFFAALEAYSVLFGGGSNSFDSDSSAPLVLKLLIIAAALGFSYAGYMIISQRRLKPAVAISLLATASFFVSASAVVFMKRIYIRNLSPQLIIMTSYLLLAIFMLSSGRILVQSETRLTVICATVCGYSSALMILSESLARLFWYNSLTADARGAWIDNPNNGFDLPTPLYLAVGITVLWLIYALSCKSGEINENNQDTESDKDNNEDKDKDKSETPENIAISEAD